MNAALLNWKKIIILLKLIFNIILNKSFLNRNKCF